METRYQTDFTMTLEHKLAPEDGHIIFIQDRFLVGGIEVLEMKVAKALIDRGYEVSVAFNKIDDLPAAHDAIKLFRHEGYRDLVDRAHQLVSSASKSIVLVTLHPSAAMAALCVADKLQRVMPSIGVGVFQWVSHSRAFFFSNAVGSTLLKRAFFRLPVDSTYFMNEPARDAHSVHWSTGLEKYKILQIVGREPTVLNDSIATDKVRIVSVGRLVPFKSYNRHAPAIVAKLRSEGLDVTWDIWGYGPDEGIISEAINALDVSSSVRLLGPLDHSKFDATVSSYDMFVGMGTAVLEAGKTETPTVVAAENASDRCYGFLFETPADSVGDIVEGHRQTLLIDCIRDFAGLDDDERRLAGRSCRESANRRESSIDEFCNAIIQSKALVPGRPVDRFNLRLFNAYLLIREIRKRMKERQ